MRVALAEDATLFREGLARVLRDEGFDVCAQCATADELLSEVERRPPHVAILDIRMPPTHSDEGARAARALRASHPSVGVLVLSQYLEVGVAMSLLSGSLEGLGYLLKERVGDLREFTDAVRRIGAGGSAVDPEIVSQLLRRRGPEPLDVLTPREHEVLALMAEGRSNGGIAERLCVSERAVQKHVTSIFAKLGLERSDDHRRVLAVLAFPRANPQG